MGFAKLLKQYTEALLSKNTTETGCRAYASAAYELGRVLIPAEIPKNIQQIAVVADAALANIPFESLLVSQISPNTPCSFAEMRYWVDSLGFSYLYSCRWLGWFGQNQPASAQSPLKILGLAPNYPIQNPPLDSLRQRFKPLAGARKEIERLRKAYDGLYLLDAAATETNLKQKASTYGIIHFAGHALADMQNPLDSRLVLAHTSETSGEDGYLHLYELSPLSLSARLVILSGCETGAGKHESGEGALSLAKGFAYAGVPSLLANLWEVPDHATHLIVGDFYEGLKKGLPKDVALQQAKQNFLRETSLQQTHPYYWAAMLQMGDTAPLQIAPIPSKKWWYAGRFLGIFAFVFTLAYYFKKRKQKA
jgi:CHAT domain-containing protein